MAQSMKPHIPPYRLDIDTFPSEAKHAHLVTSLVRIYQTYACTMTYEEQQEFMDIIRNKRYDPRTSQHRKISNSVFYKQVYCSSTRRWRKAQITFPKWLVIAAQCPANPASIESQMILAKVITILDLDRQPRFNDYARYHDTNLESLSLLGTRELSSSCSHTVTFDNATESSNVQDNFRVQQRCLAIAHHERDSSRHPSRSHVDISTQAIETQSRGVKREIASNDPETSSRAKRHNRGRKGRGIGHSDRPYISSLGNLAEEIEASFATVIGRVDSLEKAESRNSEAQEEMKREILYQLMAHCNSTIDAHIQRMQADTERRHQDLMAFIDNNARARQEQSLSGLRNDIAEMQARMWRMEVGIEARPESHPRAFAETYEELEARQRPTADFQHREQDYRQAYQESCWNASRNIRDRENSQRQGQMVVSHQQPASIINPGAAVSSKNSIALKQKISKMEKNDKAPYISKQAGAKQTWKRQTGKKQMQTRTKPTGTKQTQGQH